MNDKIHEKLNDIRGNAHNAKSALHWCQVTTVKKQEYLDVLERELKNILTSINELEFTIVEESK